MWLFFRTGKIAYSLFVMMETYIFRISYVVESLSNFGVNYNKVIVSLSRMDEILHNKLYHDIEYGDKDLKQVSGNITFDSVEFQYSEEEEKTLRGLDMKIVPHKKIAIVGRSGNGKSTIFNYYYVILMRQKVRFLSTVLRLKNYQKHLYVRIFQLSDNLHFYLI